MPIFYTVLWWLTSLGVVIFRLSPINDVTFADANSQMIILGIGEILNMELLDFPGDSRGDAHFGPFDVKTHQPSLSGEASAPTPI